MNYELTLVSHRLCPYVQRAAILLHEKGIHYQRRYVDLSNKPQWFLDISPLGKTPVLITQGEAIFESAVICEYLEDTIAPALHPASPLARAKHRGWIEFGSSLLNSIAGFYSAKDEDQLELKRNEIRQKFVQLEPVVTTPFFAGESFSLVDAVYGPIFRYFDTFEKIDNFGFFDGLSRTQQWRGHLLHRTSIIGAVDTNYPELLWQFLLHKNSALSQRIDVLQRQSASLVETDSLVGTESLPVTESLA